MTSAEQLFWSAVNKKQLGVKFRNQHPLMFFIADFYCHELKLVVEVDGGYHKKRDQYEYDKNRSAELQELDIKVIRFTNEEIEQNLTSAIENLKRIIAALQFDKNT